MPFASKVFGVQTIGLGFVQDALDSASPKMLESIYEGMNETALLVVKESKRIVPVDTGKLRSNIFVRRIGKNKFEIVAATDYASYVEYGTYKMAPQPYIRPALYRHSSTWKKKILDRFERKMKGMFRRT